LLAGGEGPFGALSYACSVQRYQHLLGYELRHVMPAKARPRARMLRLLASLLAVIAATTLVLVPPAAASAGRPSRDVPKIDVRGVA
jgi:hypothetical protein